MLTKGKRVRADQQVKNATAAYKRATAAGYNMLGTAFVDSQEDHDLYS
jgi:hypothetical protein